MIARLRQKWIYAGPSSEADRYKEEVASNHARRMNWIAVSVARRKMKEIDDMVVTVFPSAPSLLGAFDEMRTWK